MEVDPDRQPKQTHSRSTMEASVGPVPEHKLMPSHSVATVLADQAPELKLTLSHSGATVSVVLLLEHKLMLNPLETMAVSEASEASVVEVDHLLKPTQSHSMQTLEFPDCLG